MKSCVIIINENGIYKLPHKLLSNVRLRDFRKGENFKKIWKLRGIIAQSFPKMKILSIPVKNY